MSSGESSLALDGSRGSWWSGRRGGASSAHPDDQGRWYPRHARVARSLPYPQSEEGERTHAPWRLFEERVRTGPYGLTRFPSRPYSPIRILILDSSGMDAVNPRLRQFIQESPPRIRGEWQIGMDLSNPEDDTGLTQDEFNKAMKKMRKQKYSPPNPSRRLWRRGLFRNRSTTNDYGASDQEEKDEGKECVVCLETFALNEEVLITPCNHMFHNDCLVPWIRSQGRCPVCRKEFCERRRNSNMSDRNGNSGGISGGIGGNNVAIRNGNGDDLVDLIYLLRAMEEAFSWVNHPRY